MDKLLTQREAELSKMDLGKQMEIRDTIPEWMTIFNKVIVLEDNNVKHWVVIQFTNEKGEKYYLTDGTYKNFTQRLSKARTFDWIDEWEEEGLRDTYWIKLKHMKEDGLCKDEDNVKVERKRLKITYEILEEDLLER